ncbi:CIDEC protein, partial [Pteruthius melanotis]|nr:CIDEC protein [Pteruthius melanotis]
HAAGSQGGALPVSLPRCVSASASMTQQLLASPAPPPRGGRVCNWDRSLRKGVGGASLAELLRQAQSALAGGAPIALVLDEDGTAVETESFFRTLEEGTARGGLGKGQSWTAPKTRGWGGSLSRKPPRRIDVAGGTFDLYKTHPKDLGGGDVKATLYGNYSMSWGGRCYGARRLMKEALRGGVFTMQATGHVLLGRGGYMQQLLDATEEEQGGEKNPVPLPNLLPRSLPALPYKKMLQ